jgi:TniQ
VPDETEIVCELWEENLHEPSPHSRLYHLEPIGVRSALVESLTSYVARLAAAHSIHPHMLVTKELLPVSNISYLYQDNRPVYTHLTAFWKDSMALNGTTTIASSVVQALEQLTWRQDLRFLTMLPFAEVLSYRGLIRRKRAWCPMCYEEWRETGRVIYDPLLWALESIEICPHHDRRLEQHCPNPACGATQFQLTPRGQPGYCVWCNRWLGKLERSVEEHQLEREDEEWQWQRWVGNAVGELLAVAPSFSVPPSRDRIATVISMYLERRAGSSVSILARLLQLHRKTVWEWLRGQKIPQLGTLAQVCAHLRISLACLLTGDSEAVDAIQRNISLQPLPSKAPKRQFRKMDSQVSQRLQSALEAIVRNPEIPPLPMSEVGKGLGYDPSYLFKYFPNLCKEISAQYLDYQTKRGIERLQRMCDEVRQAVYTLHARGHYPSQRQIEKFVGRRGMFREQEVTTVWRDALQELGFQ